ncbi:MAG: glycoside hydrolase family 15 protein [Patescibacteria group bacterium]
MSKSVTLGNGHILVNLDRYGQLRDLYYPYVGLENQIGGHYKHQLGVWVDGRMSWLNDDSWQLDIKMDPDVFAGKITAINSNLGLELKITDSVYNEKNIFFRQIVVSNKGPARDIKIFFGQQFEPHQSHVAHTAYYDPRCQSIIHYRNRRAFLVNAELEGRGFEEFSTGVFGAEGKEGTHIDAQDGRLSGNPIEHGQADSVIGLHDSFQAGENKFLYYWLAVGHSIEEVIELNAYVKSKGPGYLIRTGQDYWHAWVNRQNFNFYGLSQETVDLFNRSLFVIRSHVDLGGGIIASGDSGMLQHGKDTYAYVWPRDSAYAALALDRVGDWGVVRKFFLFASEVIDKDGYFLHKYSPDGSVGSSWHPWVAPDGRQQLPIQEDSTASVIFALWQHYGIAKDLEFIETIYNSLIKSAADFMVTYRDWETGLPHPSYDLWEERWGVHTYTVCAVYGALMAATGFAEILGKVKSANRYRQTAEAVKKGLMEHLRHPETGHYAQALLYNKEGKLEPNWVADMSAVHGLHQFGLLAADDPELKKEMDYMVEKLSADIGGLSRYENDAYYRDSDHSPTNPWLITTMWQAQYLVDRAKKESDLDEVKKLLAWAVTRSQPDGLLAEQFHPQTGQPFSARPLVWSHAEYVRTVIAYLDKLEEFGICEACNPVY